MSALGLADAANASPYTIDYAGRLTAADGSPVAGPVDLQVSFHSAATGGHALLGAPLTFRGQTLAQGVFRMDLGLTPAQMAQLFDGGGDV